MSDVHRETTSTFRQLRDLRRGAGPARIEALSGVLEVAQSFLKEAARTGGPLGADVSSDPMRNARNTLTSAVQVALNKAAEIPHKVVKKFYEEQGPDSSKGEQ